jgi:hypothetical protein
MEWQSYRKIGSATWALAVRLNGAAMQLDERLYNRQSNAKSTRRATVAIISTAKKVKDSRKCVGMNTAAAISYVENGCIVFALLFEPNTAPLRRKLDRIVEQVETDLLDAKRIGI